MSQLVLDDFKLQEHSAFGTPWLFFSDEVIGGRSLSSSRINVAHKQLELRGQVHEGFIQAALPLVQSRTLFDASEYSGICIKARSPSKTSFALHLRSRELSMPWQHFRQSFEPSEHWADFHLSFQSFRPAATQHELDLRHLTQIGIVAENDAEAVELDIQRVALY